MLQKVLIALGILFASTPLHALEDIHLDANLYYSTRDPHWKDAEKLIDKVAADFPNLKLTKISIDDDAGYLKLAEEERNLGINSGGDLTLIAGPVHLASKGKKRDVETYIRPAMTRLFKPEAAKGRLEASVAAYVSQIFGADAKLEAADKPDQTIRYHPVTRGGKKTGWVIDAYRHVECQICNDVQFLMAVSLPELKIIDVRPVRELERLGKKLDAAETSGFLDQIKSRGADTPIKVDAITGATKTSIYYERAVNEILDELKRREKL